MQLSINEAKFAGLRVRNYATIKQVLIQKFAFGPAKLLGLSRNGPLIMSLTCCWGKPAFQQTLC